MLTWILLLITFALAAAMVALVMAMLRAERRARRNLFKTLGLSDETVDLLMARNKDVLSELALVRLSASAASEPIGPVGDEDAPEESQPFRGQHMIRLVHPITGEARHPTTSRRESYQNRHRRS